MRLEENIVVFGRILRRLGLDVTPDSTVLFTDAVAAVGLDSKARVRAAGRAIYVHRREDRDLFDRAFGLFWRRYGATAAGDPVIPRLRQDGRKPPTFPAASAAGAEGLIEEPSAEARPRVASANERLAHADFAELTGEEMRDALAMLARLRPALPRRRSRRWAVTRRRGRRPARSRMLRAALQTAAEPLRWRWLAHPDRPRPIAVICDISGSMERYSRLMLRFAHALGQSGAQVEVFVFGTRLTRITRELRVRDPDTALSRVGRMVVDWNGGTRIGESLHQLNRRWVRRTIRSSAIVLIMSDGWERGDPRQLGHEMAALRRACHRLYWLDPLASHAGFAPEVAGLRAALPHVDALLPCASVASLRDLAGQLVGAAGRDRVGSAARR